MLKKSFLEKEYVKLGKTAKQISSEIGLSDTQVRYWLRFHGLPVKPRGGRHASVDITGEVFGEYTVLEQVKGNGDCAVWKCRCSCGRVKDVRSPGLRRGVSTSCGKCQPHYNWKGFGDISGWYFSTLKRGADKRGYDFDITIEYLWSLYQTQNRKCALSGMEIFFVKNMTNEDASKRTQTASLDRIDNNKGYVRGNVQWVHKDLNRIKREYSQETFLNYVKNIYEYLELG